MLKVAKAKPDLKLLSKQVRDLTRRLVKVEKILAKLAVKPVKKAKRAKKAKSA